MTNITEHPKSGRVIRVLQITDTHLFADNSGCLLGLNTEQSLQAVIKEIQANNLPSDLILATGDLTHDGTPAAYQRIFAHLESFGLPVFCLPGNHDEALTLQQSLNDGLIQYVEHAHHGNWHFIFLDSTIPDSEKAHLTQETLQTLEKHLQSAPDTNTLICLHHQPVPTGSEWLDTMAVDNASEFLALLEKHSQVRGILWGHVHQQFDGRYKNIKLMSSPSTCVQFLPGSKDFAVDAATPGYRWLELYPDGRIETGVERLDVLPGRIDIASSGY
jgi:Icc protein